MIAYLTHDQIDKSRWDDCIAHAVYGMAYAWSWYLDVVHPGWEALVEMKEDKYMAVMPLTGKKKYGIHYLCQPFFVQQLGVFSTQALTEEQVAAFLQAIPKKFRLIEIRLNEGNPLPENLKGGQLHRNHLLDLTNNYETLSSNYHDNTKRNLKKSLNYELRLVKGVPMETVIALFRKDRGVSVSHWGDAEYQRLLRLSETALTSSNAFIYGIQSSYKQDIICCAFFIKSLDRITFLFSGNSPEGKNTHAMTFLIDQVIREYAGSETVLDFEGSDDLQLARFYQGFGSDPVAYPGYVVPLFKKR